MPFSDFFRRHTYFNSRTFRIFDRILQRQPQTNTKIAFWYISHYKYNNLLTLSTCWVSHLQNRLENKTSQKELSPMNFFE